MKNADTKGTAANLSGNFIERGRHGQSHLYQSEVDSLTFHAAFEAQEEQEQVTSVAIFLRRTKITPQSSSNDGTLQAKIRPHA